MQLISLSRGLFAKIDDDKQMLAESKTWYAQEREYGWHAATHYQGKIVYMHTFLFGEPPEGLLWDHIDRDGLNNQRENLRHANKSINAFNSKVRTDNSSGHKGVSWNKREQKWRAYIYNGTEKHLGYFDNLDDAIKARKEAEKRLPTTPIELLFK